MTMTTRGCHPSAIVELDRQKCLYSLQKGGDSNGVHIFNGGLHLPTHVLCHNDVQQSHPHRSNRGWSFIRHRVGAVGRSFGRFGLAWDLTRASDVLRYYYVEIAACMGGFFCFGGAKCLIRFL